MRSSFADSNDFRADSNQPLIRIYQAVHPQLGTLCGAVAASSRAMSSAVKFHESTSMSSLIYAAVFAFATVVPTPAQFFSKQICKEAGRMDSEAAFRLGCLAVHA